MSTITEEQIIKNWTNVVGNKIPGTFFRRTYGESRGLVKLLPNNHKRMVWNRRHGGWCSRVPEISAEAWHIIAQAKTACI